MEKQKVIFDKKNRTLFIDSMELCTAEEISKWINSYISDVLDSEISRSYLTGKLEVTVMIVCKDYLVALYRISDGSPDELIIQSVGYDKALRQSEAEKENPEAEKENPIDFMKRYNISCLVDDREMYEGKKPHNNIRQYMLTDFVHAVNEETAIEQVFDCLYDEIIDTRLAPVINYNNNSITIYNKKGIVVEHWYNFTAAEYYEQED